VNISKQFRGKSRFSTWIFTLAKNECRTALRQVIRNREKMVSLTMYEWESESDVVAESALYNANPEGDMRQAVISMMPVWT